MEVKDLMNGKRLLSVSEFCLYTGLGTSKGMAWAKEIGAVRHIGRRVLIDRVVIDRVIDEMGKKGEKSQE